MRGDLAAGIASSLAAVTVPPKVSCSIDLEQIGMVSSAGIREWIQFIEPFSRARPVMLKKCPPYLVQVMNLVANFCGNAAVESIYCDFVCTNCEDSSRGLVMIGTDVSAQADAIDAPACSKCRQKTLESVLPAEDVLYFLR